MRTLAVALLLLDSTCRAAFDEAFLDSLFDLPPRRLTRPPFRRSAARRLLQGDCDANQTLIGSTCVCSPGFFDGKSVPHLLVDGVNSVCSGVKAETNLGSECSLFVNPLDTPGVCSVLASASDGYAPYTAIDFTLNGGPRIIPAVIGGHAWIQVDLEDSRTIGGVSFRQWLSCREDTSCAGAFVGFELWVGNNAQAWDAAGNSRCFVNTDSGRLDGLNDGDYLSSPCVGEGRYVYLVMPPALEMGRQPVMPVWHLQVHPPLACVPSTPCLQCPSDMVSKAGSLSLGDCYAPTGILVNHTILYAPGELNQTVFEDSLPASIELLSYVEDLEAMLENCPAGYYCLSSTARPLACPAGTYRDVHGAESVDDCYFCPAGHYCPPAASSVTACPAGTYRATPGAGQPADCIQCDPGGYCPVASQAPTPCPSGSFRTEPGATASHGCLTCLAGHYCNASSVEPAACPAGTSSHLVGAQALSDCAVCPPGAYCRQASVAPTLCPAGVFRVQGGGESLESCAVCPEGHYCPVGSTDPAECNPGTYLGWLGAIESRECTTCPAGSYCPAASVAPVACPAGMYLDSVGGVQLGDCVPCVEGHYCLVSSAEPVGCPAGTFRETPGAGSVSDCSVCPAGQYCEGSAVVPVGCPAGTFRNGTGAMMPRDCLVCPVGSYCPFITAEPVSCPAGTYRSDTGGVDRGSCDPCPSGAYCVEQSQSPVQCHAGTYRTAVEGVSVDDCLLCPAGQYCPASTVVPTSCPAGTFRTDVAAEALEDCLVCPEGRYCIARSVTPVDCGAGYFRTLPGATKQLDCVVCPAGGYCPLRSVSPVTCPAGTFRRSRGGTSPAQCLACPAGLYCPVGTVDPFPCLAGTFRAAPGATASAQCLDCPSGGYCPDRSTAPILCAPGFHRDTPRATHLGNCLLCLPGTYDLSQGRASDCPRCPQNHYCRTSTIKEVCPTNTQSPAGSYSVLSCQCSNGFTCTYYKQVRAIATLNTTRSDFNGDVDGVRTRFIRAVAAAANVTIDHVVINGVVAPSSGQGRRLLSLQSTVPPSLGEQFGMLGEDSDQDIDPEDLPLDLEEDRPGWAVRRLLSASSDPRGIRVFASVSGALRMTRFEKHLSHADSGLLLAHQWEPSHRVQARRSAPE